MDIPKRVTNTDAARTANTIQWEQGVNNVRLDFTVMLQEVPLRIVSHAPVLLVNLLTCLPSLATWIVMEDPLAKDVSKVILEETVANVNQGILETHVVQGIPAEEEDPPLERHLSGSAFAK